MDVYFNEISALHMAENIDEAKEKMHLLLRVCGKAKHELGYNRLVIPDADFFETQLSTNYSLNNWLNDSAVSWTQKNLFLEFKRYPYFTDLDENQEAEYISSKFSLNEPEHACHDQNCDGLANAWLKKSLAVSFCSHDVWQKNKIGLTIKRDNGTAEQTQVYHACNESCIDQELIEWLRRTNLPPLVDYQAVEIWFPSANGYQISNKAKDDIIYFYKKAQFENITRIEGFFNEIWVDPFRGTGKVEPLKANLAGWWSRQIDHEHRLVYRFEDGILIVCSCRGHYSNLSCTP
jgi:toxin YoeB